MQPLTARIMLGLACLLSTRPVYALAYHFVGKQIEGPNQFLVPLRITTAFLVGSWLAIWYPGVSNDSRFWKIAGISVLCSPLIGIAAGYVAMALQPDPKTGMFTIFVVGGLAWCLLTGVFWTLPSAKRAMG